MKDYCPHCGKELKQYENDMCSDCFGKTLKMTPAERELFYQTADDYDDIAEETDEEWDSYNEWFPEYDYDED